MSGFRGSSPLTRGAPPPRRQTRWARGLIPAHAGSTLSVAPAVTSFPAHPRSRGEHVPPKSTVTIPLGSSPLTRGAPAAKKVVVFVGGLIPAHAGSTTMPLTRSATAWAHPRSRGEHMRLVVDRTGIWGSSPLTRGALARRLLRSALAGLIPAHAGSTRLLCR